MKQTALNFLGLSRLRFFQRCGWFDCSRQNPSNFWPKLIDSGLPMTIVLVSALALSPTSMSIAAEHVIEMTAEEMEAYDDGLGNKLLGYRMLSHTVDGNDITGRYSPYATIPGPTLFLTEGDTVKLTIRNAISDGFDPITEEVHHQGKISNQVSVHVHGVHYQILSDGTLKVINQLDDQGAGVGPVSTYVEYTYEWDVAPGTAGTWPYHDHNYETHNGAEHKGLYGAIIVNPVGAPQYATEYVLYLTDDSFWGMEIDGETKIQSKHGSNPSLSAARGSEVRFHVIPLGTDLHEFVLDSYRWSDPGARRRIDRAVIGPLEKHVFTVRANRSAYYRDKNFTNDLMGVRGLFEVR